MTHIDELKSAFAQNCTLASSSLDRVHQSFLGPWDPIYTGSPLALIPNRDDLTARLPDPGGQWAAQTGVTLWLWKPNDPPLWGP